MKSIITFYTKARAHTQLADFYDACAQVRLRASSFSSWVSSDIARMLSLRGELTVTKEMLDRETLWVSIYMRYLRRQQCAVLPHGSHIHPYTHVSRQVEMDEYRDYEKALGALNEASKELKKAGGSAGDKLAQLNKRLSLVER